MHCLDAFSYYYVCVAQGQLGRGESRVRAGLVLENIEGVILSSPSARWDPEQEPDLIT